MKLSKILKQVLEEQSLQGTNSELMKHLEQAVEVAKRSHELAKRYPDDAEPMFADDLGNALLRVYNALLTGDPADDTYADQLFKM